MKRLFVAWLLGVAVVVPPGPGATAAVQPCPGQSEPTPPTVIEGTFDKALQGSYVLVPFDVPAGATRVRVKVCFDHPFVPTGAPATIRNTLDLGIYQPLAPGDTLYGPKEFRGWGGSSRPNVLITPEGDGSTTVGFKPGPIPAGRWAAEIGIAAVTGPTEGNPGSTVAWRLEIFTNSLASDTDQPWAPTAYDPAPVKPQPGWYAGDFHVHAEHSNPADATMREVFDYAFDDARLDFITLSDYVTDRHWDEIGRFQADYPGHLIIRSAEVITYRGHINNHASLRYVDYRAGAIYVRNANGSLTQVRGEQNASRIFDDIHAPLDPEGRSRGWTQVNHPWIFPSQVPTFANFCRGCSWSYTDAQTDWSKVDAYEIATGPGGTTSPEGDELGPNPFTVLAITAYDHLRRLGYDITAVGSSDSHKAGNTSPISTPAGEIPISVSAPIGEATTVVYAPELSERGIRDGILAGHAYVKFFSPKGPDLRFTAKGNGTSVMMGDELNATSARFTARVFNVTPSTQPRVLLVLLNGIPIQAFPVTGTDQTFTFRGALGGDYRVQLMRGTAFEALANPITLRMP